MKSGKVVINLLAIIVTFCLILLFHFNNNKASYFELYKQDLQETVQQINSTVKTASDSIKMLQSMSNEYYNQSVQTVSPYNDLLSNLEGIDLFAITKLTNSSKQSDIGSLSGIGNINNLSEEKRREINMAFSINPYFKDIIKAIPSATWVYYTSANNFINIYPWVSPTDFIFTPSILEKDFYLLGLPENNPKRETFITDAYVDEAGQGLMVTFASPVYDKDKFKGTVALDLTLNTLSDILRDAINKDSTIIIKNEHNQIIAHSSLIKKDDTRIYDFNSVLPSALKSNIQSINDMSEFSVNKIAGYYISKYKIKDTNWEVYSYLPVLTVYLQVFKTILPDFLIIILMILIYAQTKRRKNVEEQLSFNENKYEAIFNQANQFMAILSPFGKVIETNTKALEFFNIKKEEVIGKFIWDTPWWSSHSDTKSRLISAVKLGATGQTKTYEEKYLDNNQNEHIIEYLVSPIKNSNGKLISIFTMGNDITERKRIEKELKKANNDAQIANTTKTSFISSIANEIRSPLELIVGFSQLLLQTSMSEDEKSDYLRIIDNNSEHLLMLTDEILELSKIESGKSIVTNSSFNLYDLLDDLKTMFSLVKKSDSLFFQISIDENVPQFINCDETKLRQILISLISNSFKYTESGEIKTELTFKEIDAKNYLCIEVSDTGIGISENDIKNIFNLFNLSLEEKRTSVGSGLGLAIVKKYTDLLKGEISVTSEINKGSRFRLILPIEISSNINILSISTKKVIGIKPGQVNVKILVADENEKSRLFLVKYLSSLGFIIKEAGKNDDVFDLVDEWAPDILFINIMQPDMSGIVTIRRIRSNEKYSGIAIFCTTASFLDEDKNKIITSGANEFIRKPFRLDHLLDLINKYTHVEYIYQSEKDQS